MDQTDSDHGIADKVDQWMRCADRMSSQTARLKEEICRTFGDGGETTGVLMCKILPAITLFKNTVYCDSILIPLAGKGRALELFKAFLRRPLHAFSREELMMEIYGRNGGNGRSLRLTLAMAQSTIKLISRTRVIAEKAVNTGSVKWIEWFSYDAECHRWSFYRLTNAYLLAKQNSIMGSPALPEDPGYATRLAMIRK